MIQRKQTVFLLIAVILTIVSLCLPLGSFTAGNGIGNGTATMYNLWITTSAGGYSYQAWVLFAIMLITCPISLFAIFMYHNRIVQSRFCVFNILLTLGWYIVFIVFVLNLEPKFGQFHISFTAVFPAVSMILYFLARKAIMADEALVRAADRIR